MGGLLLKYRSWTIIFTYFSVVCVLLVVRTIESIMQTQQKVSIKQSKSTMGVTKILDLCQSDSVFYIVIVLKSRVDIKIKSSGKKSLTELKHKANVTHGCLCIKFSLQKNKNQSCIRTYNQN